MENWNTYYDESKFIEEEIAWFQQNKQEFLVSILWDEDRKVESDGWGIDDVGALLGLSVYF